MQVIITGHHLEITEALKAHIDDRFAKLARHFDKVTDVHVILSVEKLVQKAEATLQISGAKLFAEDHQEDMYAAIDETVKSPNTKKNNIITVKRQLGWA